MAMQNISITLDSELLSQLDELMTEMERKRSWLIAKAIELYLEDIEDLKIAKSRLNEKRISPTQLRRELGI